MSLSRKFKRFVLKTERSDYGKAVRKAYERGEIRFKRMEVKQYTAMLDGVSNTITGVQKDNWILCVTILL